MTLVYSFLRRKGFFAITFCPLIFSFYCTAKGPPFRKLASSSPFLLEGRYRFDLKPRFFTKNQTGELLLERGKNIGKTRRSYFTLQIVGQNSSGAIRVRTYEGFSRKTGSNSLELHAERCTLSGKKHWEDYLVALERWDCDHLLFAFSSASGFRRREVLVPLQNRRTRYTDWLSLSSLEPIPSGRVVSRQSIHFAGQIMNISQETKDPRLAVVWGQKGGRLLRNGQILKVINKNGKLIGEMKVADRPGDFIICQWLTKPSQEGFIAYREK